jgi:DNA-binding response OmpR family regulator
MSAPVLVIDDSLTIRKLLELALRGDGHALHLAATAAEGLELAERVAPRLILLDHILPDRKGDAVCTALAADPRTARIPVVVMSAKGDDVRALFRPFPQVVEFVAKPFTPAAIAAVVRQVLARLPAEESAAPVSTTTTADAVATPANVPPLEQAARVLYGVLQDRLARVPEWCAERPREQAVAPFLARRLLTPDAVERVIGGLAPLVAKPADSNGVDADLMVPANGRLNGNTGVLPLLPLLRILGDAGATGELVIGGDGDRATLYLERGQLVLAVAHDETAAQQAAAAAGLAGEAERWARARLATRQDGLPLLLAFADAGDHAEADTTMLHRHGLTLLAGLCSGEARPFAWRDHAGAGAAAARLGRAIALDQVRLERLRQVDDWSQIELEVASLDQVCARSPDLRGRLERLTLTVMEREVLRQVDGRRTVRAIVKKCGFSTFEVFHILYRLIQIGVVLAQAPDPVSQPGLALCADADASAELARLLTDGRRPEPVVCADGTALAQTVAERDTRLALVDRPDEDAIAVATAVRATLESSHVRLVALMDHHDRTRHDRLLAAGFDMVLTKPVHRSVLATLMVG